MAAVTVCMILEPKRSYQEEIDSLQKVIDGYKHEIERIREDSLYKESILRTRYGMSRKDEKAFQLVH